METNSSISDSKPKIRTFLFFLLGLGSFLGLAYLFLWQGLQVGIKTQMYHDPIRWQEFHALAPRSLDILFIGSSRTVRAFDPWIVEQETQKSAFNLASDGQFPQLSFYVLQEALQTQKPQFVVYGVDGLGSEGNFIAVRNNYNFMRDAKVKRELAQSYFNLEERLLLRFPLFGHREDWRWFAAMVPGFSFQETYAGKGFAWNTRVFSPGPESEDTPSSSPKMALVEKQVAYFQQILQLCEEKGIQLFLVLLPNAPSTQNAEQIQLQNHTVKTLSGSYPHVLLDYAAKDGETRTTRDSNYSDAIHLNRSGSEIISHWISDAILSNPD